MKIAAQTNGTDLQIFVEDANWKKITLPLNKEPVKIELLVCRVGEGSIFHDAVSKPQPVTDERLIFCRDKLTLAGFKQKLKKAGFGEPNEMRLGNKLFSLKKEFADGYSLNFHDYKNNQAFNAWLAILETLEAGFLLHRLKERGHYFSRDFTEFREFNSMDEFIRHRFDLWHDATVKEFEQAIADGTATCPGCENERVI